MITADTPWRDIGDVDYQTWHDVIDRAGGPEGLIRPEAWDEARPHSALCLAMLRMESSYATDFNANPAVNMNPLNLKLPQGGGYVAFPTWAAGIAGWRDRITSELYKNGIYAETVTIRNLIHVYAPTSENDTNHYISVIVDLMNGWSKEIEPMAITFGNVPHPIYQRRIVENSKAWNNLGKRTIRGVVWHRMRGTLWGTDKYFRTDAVERALTDYGIGVKAHEPDDAGTLLMWNDPEGIRSPWANGALKAPYGDGLKFYERYGVNGINRDLVSIEISGTSWDTPLDAKSRATIVALTAYWADQYKVPWETFPMVPGEDRSFVMWHQEFTIGTGKVCPGNVVMAETSALIAQVKELLKNYQTSAPVPAPDPQYAKPQPIPAGTRVINDRLFLGVTETYTIRRQVTPRLWAEPTSPATGPDLMPGQNVQSSHVVEDVGPDSGVTIVLVDGSRIPASALV